MSKISKEQSELMKARGDFECCALYEKTKGKKGCGALRYYHSELVKNHEFVEPSQDYRQQLYILHETATNNEDRIKAITSNKLVAERWKEGFGCWVDDDFRLDDVSTIRYALRDKDSEE